MPCAHSSSIRSTRASSRPRCCAVYRAQEALGVLLAEDGPVDAADVPTLEAARRRQRCRDPGALMLRSDLKLFAAREQLAACKSSATARRTGGRRSTRSFSRRRCTPRSSSCRRTAGGCCCRRTCRSSTAVSGARPRRCVRRTSRKRRRPSRVRAPKPAQKCGRRAKRWRASNEVWPAPEPQRARRTRLSTSPASATAPAARPTSRSSMRSGRRATTTWPSRIAEDRLRRARLDLLNALGRFP